MIGTRLGHYEIVEKIGQGGMGEVYRARDTRLDRDVALKILPQEIAHSPERSRRFEQEAKAVAALSHPNILTIYDFGTEGEQSFAAMELLDGATLGERLLDGPIPPRKAIDLAAQIAAGLSAAHAQGVIHRDLKPANIFVTTDGRATILDFGLARVEQRDGAHSQSPTVQTSPGTVMGTAGYMSPEQARGEPVDARSDIFSLGAVLYEMLSGSRAFDGPSTADVIGAILRDDPKPIRETDPSFPENLDGIVQHCLEKNREERFQSARDLGFALTTARSSSQTELPRLASPARERRTGRTVLVAAAIIGWLAAAIFFVRPFSRPPTQETPARVTTLTYSGRDWAPSASPNGEMIAFTSDRDGTARIWLKQVAGGGEIPLTEGSDDLCRFSPDGSQILFVRNEGALRSLYRTSVLGATPRKLLGDVLEGDWSPDGTEVAFIRMTLVGGLNQAYIGVADVQTGEERILARIENRSCYGVRWSPAGDRIVVSETSLTGNVAGESYVDLIDVASGERKQLTFTNWAGPYTSVQWAPSGQSLVVGQAIDFLANTTGMGGQVMECDLTSGTTRPLFWANIRLPRGGWGVSTPAILDATRIVVDNEIVRQELHEFSFAGEMGQILTSGLGRDRQPVYSPDGGQILFSSNRSGNTDLWLVDRSSGGLVQLTDDPADDWDPAFSPDGRYILWSSNRAGHMEIWMANRDGSRARQVTHDGVDAENPTMTPGGEWIVYASSNDQKNGVWKIRVDGSEATRLAPGSLLLPEVSPEGRYALFSQISNLNSILQVIEIDSGKMVPFEIKLASNNRDQNLVLGRARWSPDGRAIVYIGLDEAGRSGVYKQDFVPGRDTSSSRAPVAGFSKNFAVESLGVSPDGRSVVIAAMVDQRSLKLADGVRLRGWE